MKMNLTIVVLAVLILLVLPFIAHAQGGGCPAAPSPVATSQYQTVEVAVQIAPAVLETRSPQAVGSFFQNRISFEYKPGWRVLLSSTQDGTGYLCTDDWVEVQTSSGLAWSHDFRSASRAAIVATAPVDITFLFEPGEQEVSIRLSDLMDPAHSSSPYFLVAVFDPSPPTSTPTATVTLAPKPTLTSTPTSSPTLIVVPTPTAAVVPSPTPAPSFDEPMVGSSLASVPLVLAGLLGSSLLALVVFKLMKSRELGLPGELEVYRGDQWQATIPLARFGKSSITFGKAGDVVLAGEDMPAVAARINTRVEGGDRYAVMEILNPDDPQEVLEAYQLQDGDVHQIGREYRLVYRRYQAEQSFFEGEDDDV